MRAWTRHLAVVSLLLVSIAVVDARATLTSGTSEVPSNYYGMAPPAVGGTYVDPTFGRTVKRLTNAANFSAQGIVPEYSQSSSYNLDDSYVLLYGTTGGMYELFDGSGNHIRQLAGPQEPRWSRVTPHHLYYRMGASIRRYDANTGASVTIADFSNQYSSIHFGGGTGDVSDNERIVVVGNNRYVFIYDLAGGTQFPVLDSYSVGSNTVNAATIAKDGNSYVISWNGGGGTNRGQALEQYDVNGNFIVQLLNATAHSAMGRDLDGTPVFFTTNVATQPQQPDNCYNGIVKVSLDGNATRTCICPIVQEGGSWGISKHLSAHGNDGWVYISTYRASATPNNWTTYDMEIFRVRADGATADRLVHHRSSIQNYWRTPHANISISGRKLVYGSDFMQTNIGGSYADTYVIDLQPGAPPAVAPPSGLTATGAPDPKVDLAWTDNAGNEDAYEVLRQVQGGNFQVLAMLGANATSYRDSSVTSGQQYCYQVVAHSGNSASSPSNTACATPTAAPSPPAGPTNLVTTAFDQPRIDMSWTDNAGTEDAFEVQRQGPGDPSFLTIATLAADSTSHQDTAVAAGSQYCYQVAAQNSAGTSRPSNIGCATPPAPPPPPAEENPPNAPGSLAATGYEQPRVDLGWADNSNDENAFDVLRQGPGENSYRLVATLNANMTGYSDPSVVSGSRYCYQVAARNNAGSSASSAACATPPSPPAPPPPPPPPDDEETPPSAPSSLRATVKRMRSPEDPTKQIYAVELSWIDNADNEDSFRIFRRYKGRRRNRLVGTVAADVVTFLDTRVRNRRSYCYRVFARNAAGDAVSNQVCATIPRR